MSRPGSGDRLTRLLAMVPWIIAQDGPTVAQVCERFGITGRELGADLNLLFMCGVYPYTPDALIEVDVDAGRVWVRFAEWFRRPLRFTPEEGLALVAAAGAALQAQAAAAGTAAGSGGELDQHGPVETSPLARALSKLETVLGAQGAPTLDIELGQASQEVLAALRAGAQEHRKVRLDYYSFGRDHSGERVLHPWKVFSSEGHWYVLAWCETAGGRRLFRADRARSAVLLDEEFAPPQTFGPLSTYESQPDDPLVVIDLAPEARWVASQYPNESITDIGGGYVRVSLRASSSAWLERLLLIAGPHATVVSGADGVVEAAARRVLRVYEA